MATTDEKATAFKAAMALAAAKRERITANRALHYLKRFAAQAVDLATAGDLGDAARQARSEAEAWDRMEDVRHGRECLRTHHSIVGEANIAFYKAADIARNVDSE